MYVSGVNLEEGEGLQGGIQHQRLETGIQYQRTD